MFQGVGVRNEVLCLVAGVFLSPFSSVFAGWFDTGDMLYDHGYVDSARRVYQELVSLKEVPQDAVLYRIAECEVETDRDAYAQAKYRLLMRVFPNSEYCDESQFRLLVSQSRSEDREKRQKAAKDLVELAFGKGDFPFAEEALFVAATVHYSDGQYSDALRLGSLIVRRWPKSVRSVDVHRLIRWSAYLGGNVVAVAKYCTDEDEESRSLRAAMVGDLFATAARAEKRAELDRAIECYDLLITYFPGAVASEAMFRKATVFMDKGEWSVVDDLLGNLIDLQEKTPRHAEALYLRGVSHWKMGDVVMCTNYMQQALNDGLVTNLAVEADNFLKYLRNNRTETRKGTDQEKEVQP